MELFLQEEPAPLAAVRSTPMSGACRPSRWADRSKAGTHGSARQHMKGSWVSVKTNGACTHTESGFDSILANPQPHPCIATLAGSHQL